MEKYLVVYRWLSRPESRSGRLNRVGLETQTTRVIHQPSLLFGYNFGEQEQVERSLVPAFLHFVLSNIRAATHDFTEAPGEDHDNEQLAVRVLTALMLLRNTRSPGMAQHTCLMCECPVTGSMPWSRDPIRVSMERRHLSCCGRWTLHEIYIFASWRDDVDSPQLCASHASEFRGALEAVLAAGALDQRRPSL